MRSNLDPETGRVRVKLPDDRVPAELIEAALAERAADALPELVGWEPEAPADDGADDPYPDWNEQNSRVVSGPIGLTKYPGHRAENWHAARTHARAYAKERNVKLYKFWTVPGRWFARVGR